MPENYHGDPDSAQATDFGEAIQVVLDGEVVNFDSLCRATLHPIIDRAANLHREKGDLHDGNLWTADNEFQFHVKFDWNVDFTGAGKQVTYGINLTSVVFFCLAEFKNVAQFDSAIIRSGDAALDSYRPKIVDDTVTSHVDTTADRWRVPNTTSNLLVMKVDEPPGGTTQSVRMRIMQVPLPAGPTAVASGNYGIHRDSDDHVLCTTPFTPAPWWVELEWTSINGWTMLGWSDNISIP
jgi:hypothetical protein